MVMAAVVAATGACLPKKPRPSSRNFLEAPIPLEDPSVEEWVDPACISIWEVDLDEVHLACKQIRLPKCLVEWVVACQEVWAVCLEVWEVALAVVCQEVWEEAFDNKKSDMTLLPLGLLSLSRACKVDRNEMETEAKSNTLIRDLVDTL